MLFAFEPSADGRLVIWRHEGEGEFGPFLTDDGVELLAERDGGRLEASRGFVGPGGTGDGWLLLSDASDLPPEAELLSRREIASLFGEEVWGRAAAAYQMMRFESRNRFCGTCGKPAARSETDMAMVCGSCGERYYPSPAPAMITAVTRGDEILLGRNKAFRGEMYSVLAGFVEPGESVESTVAREIWEEARVRVRNIRYVTSQSWPFPNSLMLAFAADWESGEPEPGDGELADVRWFRRDALPAIPQPPSVARKLLDAWLAGEL